MASLGQRLSRTPRKPFKGADFVNHIADSRHYQEGKQELDDADDLHDQPESGQGAQDAEDDFGCRVHSLFV